PQLQRLHTPPTFPYTTLFRSEARRSRTADGAGAALLLDRGRAQPAGAGETDPVGRGTDRLAPAPGAAPAAQGDRAAQADGRPRRDRGESQDFPELAALGPPRRRG